MQGKCGFGDGGLLEEDVLCKANQGELATRRVHTKIAGGKFVEVEAFFVAAYASMWHLSFWMIAASA